MRPLALRQSGRAYEHSANAEHAAVSQHRLTAVSHAPPTCDGQHCGSTACSECAPYHAVLAHGMLWHTHSAVHSVNRQGYPQCCGYWPPPVNASKSVHTVEAGWCAASVGRDGCGSCAAESSGSTARRRLIGSTGPDGVCRLTERSGAYGEVDGSERRAFVDVLDDLRRDLRSSKIDDVNGTTRRRQ